MYRCLARAGVDSPDQMLELHLRTAGLHLGCLAWEAEVEAAVLSPLETEVGAEFSCCCAGRYTPGSLIVLHRLLGP